MSLREYLDTDRAFNFHHIKTNKLKVGKVTHEEYNNMYHIKDDSDNHLLSFDSNRNLHTSAVKNYCDAIDAKHNVNHSTHAMMLRNITESITALSQSVPTDENFDDLKTRVENIENYINNIKEFMRVFSESVNLKNSNNTTFDFTKLVN